MLAMGGIGTQHVERSEVRLCAAAMTRIQTHAQLCNTMTTHRHGYPHSNNTLNTANTFVGRNSKQDRVEQDQAKIIIARALLFYLQKKYVYQNCLH
jgi:hypothetical protein